MSDDFADLVDLPGSRANLERRLARRKAGVCMHCGKRRASIKWGDALAVTHGWTENRCGTCVYGAQLRHALVDSIRIPVLTARFLFAWVRRA